MKERHGPLIDYRRCTGCRKCYQECPDDVFEWDEERAQPIVSYPNECHYCGICDIECLEEAIRIRWPLHAMLDMGIYPKL